MWSSVAPHLARCSGCSDQVDARGDRGQRRGGHERVQRVAVEHAAIAALGQPLRQREHQVEAERLGLEHEVAVVLEAPVCRARQRGGTPAAGLDGQEQAEQERLLQGLRVGTVGELGRGREPVDADQFAGAMGEDHGWVGRTTLLAMTIRKPATVPINRPIPKPEIRIST
jgi:hypothetical protein